MVQDITIVNTIPTNAAIDPTHTINATPPVNAEAIAHPTMYPIKKPQVKAAAAHTHHGGSAKIAMP